jgi:hypothetical protein
MENGKRLKSANLPASDSEMYCEIKKCWELLTIPLKSEKCFQPFK